MYFGEEAGPSCGELFIINFFYANLILFMPQIPGFKFYCYQGAVTTAVMLSQ
jgi:hypothetical protein